MKKLIIFSVPTTVLKLQIVNMYLAKVQITIYTVWKKTIEIF